MSGMLLKTLLFENIFQFQSFDRSVSNQETTNIQMNKSCMIWSHNYMEHTLERIWCYFTLIYKPFRTNFCLKNYDEKKWLANLLIEKTHNQDTNKTSLETRGYATPSVIGCMGLEPSFHSLAHQSLKVTSHNFLQILGNFFIAQNSQHHTV